MTYDIEVFDNPSPTPPLPHPRHPRPRRRVLKAFVYGAGIIVIAGLVFFSRALISEDGTLFNTLSLINTIAHFGQSSENMLKGEQADRINILLLGMGGKNHDGGYLTDTIMLASIVPSAGDVALLSIPRDLTVPIEGYGWRKVNNINAFAENEKRGSGGVAVSQALSKVLDLPIDYYVRVDFTGFEQIIDELGGIEVDVENTLDDYRYPILGQEDNPVYDARFQHLHVEKGLQKMDGGLALKFARSRHAAGIEGSDFARARRQQQVLKAVKEKLLNKNMLLRPRSVSAILSTVNDHVDTNFKTWELIKLWDIIKDTDTQKITTKVLDNSSEGLLVDGTSPEGAYVLQPRSGDFSEIQYLAQHLLENAPVQKREAVHTEQAKLEIHNGTWVAGLAQRSATDLEKFGFEIVRVTNAVRQNYEQSVIYDLTYGEKMQSLEILKEKTGAKVHYGLPEWMIEELQKQPQAGTALVQPDFILILGQPADTTNSGAENEEK